jgi:membrane-bound metal-dependent hydrolase YbcI (DUF457 family)
MDLFTHVLYAYLLSFVLWGPAAPQYIAAGALAGGLPDADVLLFPLARKFPALEHRGIVHTVLSVTAISIAGAFLLPYLPYFPHASTLLYFVAMEIGGVSHLVLDGLTSFAVTPLQPFSKRVLRLDVEVGVNFGMLGVTLASLTLLAVERGTVPFSIWTYTTWGLVALYGGYLLLRGGTKLWALRIARRSGYRSVMPTSGPWAWIAVECEETAARYRIRYRTLNLGSGFSGPDHAMDVATQPPTAGPVDSAAAALDRSYAPALALSELLAMRYRFGQATERGSVFDVVWYMVGVGGFGRSFGVKGTVDRATGEVRLKSGFVRIPAPDPS